MVLYIVRRIAYSAVALFTVAAVTFLMVYGVGDPAQLLLPPGSQSPAEIARFRELHGLDRPLIIQFADYIWSIARGDFGSSLRYGLDAMDLAMERMPATLELTATSILLAAGVGVPLGVVAATRKGTRMDHSIVALSSLGLAAPSFWIGTMLILLFSVSLGVLPPSGSGSLSHLVMPALTLALVTGPVMVRFTRSAMIESLQSEYIVTAKAKGMSSRVVVLRHGLRNALIPVVTVVGLETGVLLGGAVVTESVFSWPGIGQLAVEAVEHRDLPVVMATVLLSAALFLLVNLIVDLIYLVVNPAVRFE